MRTLVVVGVCALSGMLTACQNAPDATGPVSMRATAPPWETPADTVSYIEAAGMEQLPIDFRAPSPYYVKLIVTVDGKPVPLPRDIGIDRARSVQASVHTHGGDGIVRVEARNKSERPTVQQFFEVWGVRYDEQCLGDACGGVVVRVNGAEEPWDAELQPNSLIEVVAEHE